MLAENLIPTNKNKNKHTTEAEEQMKMLQLPSDLHLSIFTFCDVADLLRVSQVNSIFHYMITQDSIGDNILWKSHAKRHFLTDVDSPEVYFKKLSKDHFSDSTHSGVSTLFSHLYTTLTHKPYHGFHNSKISWRMLVQHTYNLHFHKSSLPSNNGINLTNQDHTMTSMRDNRWDNIRTNLPMVDGGVYCWEYKLTQYDLLRKNSFKVFMGIERSTYAFSKNEFDKIVGYNSLGISYNLGKKTIHRNKQHQLNDYGVATDNMNWKFVDNDVISLRLDLKKTFSLQIFRNGVWIVTIPDIPKNIIWYATISVVGNHTIQVRPGTSRSLCLPKQMTTTPL